MTALPYRTFAGADAISVHRDSLGTLTQLEFVYHTRRDLDALVNDYRSSLGPPFSVITDTLAGAIRTTTRWQNEDTEFEISTLTPPLKDSVGAVALLKDRLHPR